jgi:uncharacterized protein YdeI (YjbR/CyaY-like superfamily)
MTARAFPTPAAFRAWLKKHHRTRTELVVLLFRAHAAERGMTYPQALDEALCFGWIDGVRRSVDADRYSVRFSPRKPRSIWSRVNVAHVERLIRDGAMEEPGLAAYRARSEQRTGVYSFEGAALTLAPAYQRLLRANAAAWNHFRSQPPWYRRTCSHWVMNAKREQTRLRRIGIVIRCSQMGHRIPPLRQVKAARGARRSRGA